MSKETNELYVPFGHEWEKAMMEMTKTQLVRFLKRVLLERDREDGKKEPPMEQLIG